MKKSPAPDPWPPIPAKIISGRAKPAWTAARSTRAIALGIPHGGWCPRGRLAEDGKDSPPLSARRNRVGLLSGTHEAQRARGRRHVDPLPRVPVRGGTELTVRLAKQHRRPRLVVDLDHPPDLDKVRPLVAIASGRSPQRCRSPREPKPRHCGGGRRVLKTAVHSRAVPSPSGRGLG